MESTGFITVTGCRKCGRCDSVCPTYAIERIDGIPNINHEKCDLCMRCIVVCPNKAFVLLD